MWPRELTIYLFRILKGIPRKELQWRLYVDPKPQYPRPSLTPKSSGVQESNVKDRFRKSQFLGPELRLRAFRAGDGIPKPRRFRVWGQGFYYKPKPRRFRVWGFRAFSYNPEDGIHQTTLLGLVPSTAGAPRRAFPPWRISHDDSNKYRAQGQGKDSQDSDLNPKPRAPPGFLRHRLGRQQAGVSIYISTSTPNEAILEVFCYPFCTL